MIDNDYRGDVGVVLFNFGDEDFKGKSEVGPSTYAISFGMPSMILSVFLSDMKKPVLGLDRDEPIS